MKHLKYALGVFLFFSELAVSSACSDNLVEFQLNHNHEKIWLEIADTHQERKNGLMYRSYLASNSGMLFIYDKPQFVKFWMKNTQIPLDIIFINDKGLIVRLVTNTVPFSIDPIESGQKVQYVLEVNSGYSKQMDLFEGGLISGIAKFTTELKKC